MYLQITVISSAQQKQSGIDVIASDPWLFVLHHWLRKNITCSPKYNQPIFMTFSEHIAQLFLLKCEGEVRWVYWAWWRYVESLAMSYTSGLVFFESLRWCPLSHSISPAHNDGAMETQVGWDVQYRCTFSHILPLHKKFPQTIYKKRKINRSKSDLQLIGEMEWGLTQKIFFLLVKQQPNPHLGGIHAIYLECLHRTKNGERAFCIFFLLLLMQWNIWETRTRGSFLLMARTYFGGVWLKSEERKCLLMKEYSGNGNGNACALLKTYL